MDIHRRHPDGGQDAVTGQIGAVTFIPPPALDGDPMEPEGEGQQDHQDQPSVDSNAASHRWLSSLLWIWETPRSGTVSEPSW